MGLGKLFPARESLVSDIPAGDGNTLNLVLQCTEAGFVKSFLNISTIKFFLLKQPLAPPSKCSGLLISENGHYL